MAQEKEKNNLMEKIVSLSKRRGFVFPSSEIYGGLANTYDYGPYGVALKNNLLDLWRKHFIFSRDDLFEIEASIILNPRVWEASGHVANFGDVKVEDSVTHKRYRADHLIEDYFLKNGKEVTVDGKSAAELQEIIEKEKIVSPDGNSLTPAKKFNMLFETEIGVIEGEKNKAYFRGEIAQGLFLNYKNILDTMRPKLPFGVAQAGKAFRNEITTGQFTFRTLEFDLMEFEYFFDVEKDSWEKLFDFWKKEVYSFARSVGLCEDHLRWRAHEDFELSHYSKRTEDLEYRFPWGFKEMFAVAYRTDFDLKNHEEKSGVSLRYTYPDGKKVLPHVVEPTFGLSRLLSIVLFDAFCEEDVSDGKRTVLKFDKKIAPVKIAVFPLLKNKPELVSKAREVYDLLKKQFVCEFDDHGNVGKRYRRQDEIGTPYCVTIDFDSLEHGDVTVRDRDTMRQERVSVSKLLNYFLERFL